MKHKDESIQDVCFSINTGINVDGEVKTMDQQFTGLVSLCNTTVSAFSMGIHCGISTILFTAQSSIIFNRGHDAIVAEHPKYVKIHTTSFIKCEGNGLYISQKAIENEPAI
jgi:hypothetical protein